MSELTDDEMVEQFATLTEPIDGKERLIIARETARKYFVPVVRRMIADAVTEDRHRREAVTNDFTVFDAAKNLHNLQKAGESVLGDKAKQQPIAPLERLRELRDQWRREAREVYCADELGALLPDLEAAITNERKAALMLAAEELKSGKYCRCTDHMCGYCDCKEHARVVLSFDSQESAFETLIRERVEAELRERAKLGKL